VAVLSSDQRRLLERAVVAGRRAAESAAVAVVTRLGVAGERPPAHLSATERELRRGLRARARQLGDPLERAVGADSQGPCPLLVGQVAYEQWHRLLFARFLEVNGLLCHPKYGAPVTLAECDELASELDEPDGWTVAARFAAELVPGIFTDSDPCAAVRLAPEDRLALERVVTSLPPEIFTAEDALGWVYQYWQSRAKAEVNVSGRKIGGADLAPVTQLFTENYMVRFLLENSLGAWWAARHPESPLVGEWVFLRRGEDSVPAAGRFDEWPATAAGVTVMDPCCGSGHFLVAAFGMLWRMRAEEEGLDIAAAQDAVLRDNLFGLELDPRCTQIAMFALAMDAWKSGGYRTLPVPQVACSGIPARALLSEWTTLAEGKPRLEAALDRLHALFAEADTLGSLIDPMRAAEQAGLESVDWHDIAPLLEKALASEAMASSDPAVAVFGEAATGIARAAAYLSRRYDLVATNVPYLGRSRQSTFLRTYLDGEYVDANAELAAAFLLRYIPSSVSRSVAVVLPDTIGFLGGFQATRRHLLRNLAICLLTYLGAGAFSSISGEVVRPMLLVGSSGCERTQVCGVDVSGTRSLSARIEELAQATLTRVDVKELLRDADSPLRVKSIGSLPRLGALATATEGLSTGDDARYRRHFWELVDYQGTRRVQGPPSDPGNAQSGLEDVVLWSRGHHDLPNDQGARLRGGTAWGHSGILLARIGGIRSTRYLGDLFDKSCVALVPRARNLLPALACYLKSDDFASFLKELDRKVAVATKSVEKVPFDSERWRAVAATEFPDGLPEPWSDDAAQWLFRGTPAGSRQPLQVTVARLSGFRWPDQGPDALDEIIDADGIVCLPAVAGEQSAAERVRAALSASYGKDWSTSRLDELLVAVGGEAGDLAGWLRDGFFKDHCRLFSNRPFVWHVWDGRRDGFSALLNYHRLDGPTLQKLTYTYLGWWIDRQRTDAGAGVAGAEARLAAALELQRKLALIAEGAPPYDIYVRWKALAEQPLGWEPDLDDGVRLNVRPFVEAGVLRAKFNVHWKKDRGANPDGSERHNDLHLTLAEKRVARARRA
jgi:hypothetical protein